MRIIYPEDMRHVSSFDELMESDGPVLWPCIEPQIVPKGRVQTIGEAPTYQLHDSFFSYADSYEGNGWSIFRAKNVFIQDHIIHTSDGDIFAVIPRWRIYMKLDWCDRNDKEGMEKGLEKFFLTPSHREIVTVDGPSTPFYQGPHGHWMYEGFLPLAVWKKLGFMPNLLITEPMPTYRHQFLDLMQGPKAKLSFINRFTHDLFCKDLWLVVPWASPACNKSVYSGSIHESHFSPIPMERTKNYKYSYSKADLWLMLASDTTLEMTRSIGAKASAHLGRGEKIFLRREKSAQHRIYLNEAEVLRIAEKHGFVIVSPSLLSAEEEAAVFHQAKIICGSVEGALFNTAFCKPGTRVICLSASEDIVWPIQSICTVNQLELTIFRSPQFSSMDNYYNGALSLYVIDLVAFDELLSSLH